MAAASAFAWTNMPDICLNATDKVKSESPDKIISESLASVGKGVQDENKDRNANFTQQEDTFIATWTATEASFYYGAPEMKSKRADFVKAVVNAYRSQKGKEQKIFLLGLLQNCPDDASLGLLKDAMNDKDKDVADAARMAMQQNPEAGKLLAQALKTSKDKVLKSGVVSALATRAYDGKKVPPVVKQIQASEKNNVTCEVFKKKPDFGASLMAGRAWYENKGLEEFATAFYAKPDKATASKAISSGNEREFVVVAPYAFAEFPELAAAAKDRFAKCDNAVQAWVFTAIGDHPSDAGRDFIIETLGKTKDENVRLGAAWALSCIGDEKSGLAACALHKAIWDDGQPSNIRNLAEYAVGAMKPSKALDNAILEGAKKFDRSSIRLVAARGVFDAFPYVMDAIKQGKERGDALWVVEQMGMEKDFLTICELAISTKDNELLRRLMPLSQAVARRINGDPKPFLAEVEKMKAKAEAAGVNAPWDRIIEMISYKGFLPKKR